MAQGQTGLVDRDSAHRRRVMVDGQIRTFDVTDQRVLDMFYKVPRETSLPASLAPFAYSDAPIVLPPVRPGEGGRTLLQPMFLAKLLQGASLDEGCKTLVVAGATGYAAAIVAGLTGAAVSLESEAGLSDLAAAYVASLGIGDSVTAVTGPLGAGHAAGGPYDRIIVAGAVEEGLETLFKQLAPGGCLLAIVTRAGQASRRAGKAMRFDNVDGEISSRTLFDATAPVLEAFKERPAFVF